LCAFALAVGVFGSSSPARAALSSAEATCRQRVGTEGRLLFQSVQKALAKCRGRTSKGALPPMTDCAVEPKTASKISRAETKLTAKVTASCSNGVLAQLVFGGTCYGTTTAADLASCLIDTHEEQAFALAEVVYDASGSLGVPQQKCQAAASKEGQKLARKRHKLIARCKDKVGRGALPSATDCGAEVAANLASAAAQGAANITTRCPSSIVASLTFGAPCAGVSTAAALTACVLGQEADRDDRLIAVE
jgi:hypothetical protein